METQQLVPIYCVRICTRQTRENDALSRKMRRPVAWGRSRLWDTLQKRFRAGLRGDRGELSHRRYGEREGRGRRRRGNFSLRNLLYNYFPGPSAFLMSLRALCIGAYSPLPITPFFLLADKVMRCWEGEGNECKWVILCHWFCVYVNTNTFKVNGEVAC